MSLSTEKGIKIPTTCARRYITVALHARHRAQKNPPLGRVGVDLGGPKLKATGGSDLFDNKLDKARKRDKGSNDPE